MLSVQHIMSAIKKENIQPGQEAEMSEYLAAVVFPDAIRAYSGPRQYSHFEESPNGDDASYWVIPTDMSNVSKESITQSIEENSHMAEVIPAAIGENTSLETFFNTNTETMGAENPTMFYGVKDHLVQDITFDKFIREKIDCTDKYNGKFSIGERELDDKEVRTVIGEIEQQGIYSLAKQVYEQTGITANAQWFEDTIKPILEKEYPSDLAEKTFNFMKIDEKINEYITNHDWSHINEGLISEQDYEQLYEEIDKQLHLSDKDISDKGIQLARNNEEKSDLTEQDIDTTQKQSQASLKKNQFKDALSKAGESAWNTFTTFISHPIQSIKKFIKDFLHDAAELGGSFLRAVAFGSPSSVPLQNAMEQGKKDAEVREKSKENQKKDEPEKKNVEQDKEAKKSNSQDKDKSQPQAEQNNNAEPINANREKLNKPIVAPPTKNWNEIMMDHDSKLYDSFTKHNILPYIKEGSDLINFINIGSKEVVGVAEAGRLELGDMSQLMPAFIDNKMRMTENPTIDEISKITHEAALDALQVMGTGSVTYADQGKHFNITIDDGNFYVNSHNYGDYETAKDLLFEDVTDPVRQRIVLNKEALSCMFKQGELHLYDLDTTRTEDGLYKQITIYKGSMRDANDIMSLKDSLQDYFKSENLPDATLEHQAYMIALANQVSIQIPMQDGKVENVFDLQVDGETKEYLDPSTEKNVTFEMATNGQLVCDITYGVKNEQMKDFIIEPRENSDGAVDIDKMVKNFEKGLGFANESSSNFIDDGQIFTPNENLQMIEPDITEQEINLYVNQEIIFDHIDNEPSIDNEEPDINTDEYTKDDDIEQVYEDYEDYDL